ncbi:MAG: cyclic nucleotide-binding domain-containing protein [Deltaproteobacteria bacterium]|jgi:CRP/FNR family transcriptional regulator|nr:cyclic nucleotide-binding domain-containing protein [Deltaproteobacteria bacterium]MDO8956756.1 cyclic nucleotide-binding domain-containing protein [Deltaproteobacteria bacterium]MDO9211839.1 cyclic nucleotide-binding domain-containing protein [Deltaproteobacteria bacterium]
MKEEEQLFKKFGRLFPAGTILFEEGQACTGMFIIQKGQVRLYKKVGKEEVTIDVLKEGDFFGEMACLIGQPRSINAVVEGESQILVVQPEVLDSLFRGTSGIGLKVVANLAARLKKAYEIIEKMIAERQPVADKESDPP